MQWIAYAPLLCSSCFGFPKSSSSPHFKHRKVFHFDFISLFISTFFIRCLTMLSLCLLVHPSNLFSLTSFLCPLLAHLLVSSVRLDFFSFRFAIRSLDFVISIMYRRFHFSMHCCQNILFPCRKPALHYILTCAIYFHIKVLCSCNHCRPGKGFLLLVVIFICGEICLNMAFKMSSSRVYSESKCYQMGLLSTPSRFTGFRLRGRSFFWKETAVILLSENDWILMWKVLVIVMEFYVIFCIDRFVLGAKDQIAIK